MKTLLVDGKWTAGKNCMPGKQKFLIESDTCERSLGIMFLPLFIMILIGHVLCGCESSDGLTPLELLFPVNVITLRFQSNTGLPTITDFTCRMRD